MGTKEKLTNAYLLLFLPVGFGAAIWAIAGFPWQKAGAGLIAFSVATVFFSSYLRIQLPRTKIHLTISDALILLSLLIYGGEIAVLLAIFEAAFTSLNLRRQGLLTKSRTIVINILTATISIFPTSIIVAAVFGSTDAVLASGDLRLFAALLATMALSQFLINSFCVSLFMAARTQKSVWQVWYDDCLNVLVMFICGALMAGLMAKALQQIDIVLLAAVVAFFSVIYWTYRRSSDDVKRTAAKAEESERERAEQAEGHVRDLKHYVSQLEETGRELEQSRESFRHAAYHDALSGLPNRNYFIDVLKALLEKSRCDPAYTFTVLFLDLNRFRTINDSLGHSTGDRILRGVAQRLSKMTRQGDFVGHFGADEFAFILTEIHEPRAAVEFAHRVTKEISESFRFKGRQVYTSVSVGIAFGGSEYSFAEDILRDADIAMYYAKDNKESCVIFDKTMHTQAVSLQQIETDLRYAIVCNELELFYQPIIDLDTITLVGFEALVRWNHPKLGLIPPSEFISISEDTGLIIPMTLQILRTACSQVVEWQNQSLDNKSLTVSVNLSGKHFAQADLVEQITKIVSDTKIDPTCLKLEITESVVMENAENAIAMLQRIRDTGVRLSVDDFGTGYSSLSYLHSLPIDTLKVDRSFVNMMDGDGENAEIVHTIIALAHTLKLNVIAEGIETIQQLDQLRILGCEYGQGYLFSRPVPVAEIEKLLEDNMRWKELRHHVEHSLAGQSYEYPQFGISH